MRTRYSRHLFADERYVVHFGWLSPATSMESLLTSQRRRTASIVSSRCCSKAAAECHRPIVTAILFDPDVTDRLQTLVCP